ncbi:uncharacterized protein EKO05_0009943 [Ascochyta rabiei]|uniref:uncharacterized protein n=1 Tax=Didymella rabiei TaxID=5454 RepID=UPI0019004625|nr:uncharacterized protein EKO05_0009943 [Ascochyta rabiei]UPX19688.1 hypothetical protein EKO05_0009943 [Ascochyta rabiei]
MPSHRHEEKVSRREKERGAQRRYPVEWDEEVYRLLGSGGGDGRGKLLTPSRGEEALRSPNSPPRPRDTHSLSGATLHDVDGPPVRQNTGFHILTQDLIPARRGWTERLDHRFGHSRCPDEEYCSATEGDGEDQDEQRDGDKDKDKDKDKDGEIKFAIPPNRILKTQTIHVVSSPVKGSDNITAAAADCRYSTAPPTAPRSGKKRIGLRHTQRDGLDAPPRPHPCCADKVVTVDGVQSGVLRRSGRGGGERKGVVEEVFSSTSASSSASGTSGGEDEEGEESTEYEDGSTEDEDEDEEGSKDGVQEDRYEEEERYIQEERSAGILHTPMQWPRTKDGEKKGGDDVLLDHEVRRLRVFDPECFHPRLQAQGASCRDGAFGTYAQDQIEESLQWRPQLAETGRGYPTTKSPQFSNTQQHRTSRSQRRAQGQPTQQDAEEFRPANQHRHHNTLTAHITQSDRLSPSKIPRYRYATLALPQSQPATHRSGAYVPAHQYPDLESARFASAQGWMMKRACRCSVSLRLITALFTALFACREAVTWLTERRCMRIP